MISEVQQDDILLNLNPEVHDFIDKLWIKSTATTKEQKDKSMSDVFHSFLQILNKNINESNSPELTDLIYDKSILISDTLNNYEWPNAESLKVSNLHRLTLFFYFYIKTRITLFHPKAKKQTKDITLKACENLIQLLNILIELSYIGKLQTNLITLIFQDLYTIYTMVPAKTAELNEQIKGILSYYNEETNIGSLIKMKSINNSAKNNFFIGTQSILLAYKIALYNQVTDQKIMEKHESDLKLINQHYHVLSKKSFLGACEFVWLMSMLDIINGKMTKDSLKRVISLFMVGKKYQCFLKNSKISDIINSSQNIMRSLIAIAMTNFNIKINTNMLAYLNYGVNDSFGLLTANRTNLLSIKKLLKEKENMIYKSLKLSSKIIDVISANALTSNEVITYDMVFEDCNELSHGANKTIVTLEELTNESYLHNVIKGKYHLYDELKKKLETIK